MSNVALEGLPVRHGLLDCTGSRAWDVQVCDLGKERWGEILDQFSDASFYQTWSYGASRDPRLRVSHIVLRNGSAVIGACQVEQRRIRGLSAGIGYAVWGPLWSRKDSERDPSVYSALIAALKQHGRKRGSLLRIWPHVTGDLKKTAAHILERHGFARNPATPPYRTLRLDLSPSIEELRMNLVPRWRTSLNKAERNNLEIVEGTGDEFFGLFMKLSLECEQKKGFTAQRHYFEALRRAQADFSERMKLRFAVCQSQGEPLCIAAYSPVGEVGVYVLGATGEKGYGLNAAYLLQWLMILRLKESGVRWYDLGGVDPNDNPGVYRFKAGVAGKAAIDEIFLGEYEGCFGLRARLARLLLRAAKRSGGSSGAWLVNSRKTGTPKDGTPGSDHSE